MASQTRRHGLGARKRGDLRDAVLDRLGSQLVAIVTGGMPERRVDHERDIAGDQHVEHVGLTFADFLNRCTVYTGGRSVRDVPSVATMRKPSRTKSRAIGTMPRLSRSHTLTNTVPPSGSL